MTTLSTQSRNTSVAKFTGQDAKDLDAAIRSTVRTAHIALAALEMLVGQAQENQIHQTLGFPTWSAYLADALDGQWKIEKDRRGEAIKFLTEQGVSQRQITKITGASKGTIHRELHGAPLGQLLAITTNEPVIDGETDSEFRTRLIAEREASKNADGRVVFRIPATIEEARTVFEKMAQDQRRLQRIQFDMMLAWTAEQPKGCLRNAWEFGLMLRFQRAQIIWMLDDGLGMERISELSGYSVEHLDEILDAPTCSDDEFFARIVAEAAKEAS